MGLLSLVGTIGLWLVVCLSGRAQLASPVVYYCHPLHNMYNGVIFIAISQL
jgi:hypothetical protein